MKTITTVFLLLIMSITVPAYADNHDEKGHDPGHDEIWNRIIDLEKYVDDQLQIVFDRLTAIEEEQSDETGDVKTLFTQQTVMQNDIGNLQTQVDSISNDDIEVNDLESRMLILEELVIPDFEKSSELLSYSTSYTEEYQNVHIVGIQLELQAYHDGDWISVQFSDPTIPNGWLNPSSMVNPDRLPTDNLGNSSIISERGIEKYSFTMRYGDNLTGDVRIKVYGSGIDHIIIVTIPKGF